MSVSGSCICGDVQYRVSVDPQALVNCHCNFCRSLSGAAFSSYLVVPEGALEIVAGADAIASHEFKAGALKHFCRHCGTPLYNRNAKYRGLCMLYLGTAARSVDFIPTANIYCESQLPWVPHIGEIRNFAQGIAKS